MKENRLWPMLAAVRRLAGRPIVPLLAVLFGAALLDALTGGDALAVLGRVLLDPRLGSNW